MLPEAVEGAHQGHPDFRVGGRIFATLWTEEDRVVVKLMPEAQAEMVAASPEGFEPVPGAWGSRGWTSVDLFAVEEEVLRGALLAAWKTAAPLGLVARFAALAVDPDDDRQGSGETPDTASSPAADCDEHQRRR